MRGKILSKALEILRDGAVLQADFFIAVLRAGYGASMSKIDYEYRKQQRISATKKFQRENLKASERRLRVFISKMKHDGLIHESDNNFIISQKGKERLEKLQNNLPNRHYQKSKNSNQIIISFDIPEKFRRKRDWLREVVRNLGFKMVHQSVWMGKTTIPKDFIFDLENLKILEFVEIFEISKTGSLKKLV